MPRRGREDSDEVGSDDSEKRRRRFAGDDAKCVASESVFGEAAQFLPADKEADPHRLAQRRKQVDYGKNTLAYERYAAAVPYRARKYEDPRTPDITMNASKRAFDGLVREWRQSLHRWEEAHPAGGMALAVPKARQEEAWDCGLACAQMALRALGVGPQECSLAALRARLPCA